MTAFSVCLALMITAIPSRGEVFRLPPQPELADRIAACTERAIADGAIPGAVVLVGRGEEILYAGPHGKRALVPQPEDMTRDTIFDMASLTKPIATATSIMILVDDGKLRLDDRLGTILPEFDNQGKGDITIEQLLRHRSGLIADNPIGDYDHGVDEAWARLASLKLATPRGERFLYSDVNFIILGRVVERTSNMTLDEFAYRRIFGPLKMNETKFRRLSVSGTNEAREDPTRVAPTELVDGRMLRGIVHDPRSFRLDGVAGHAGLFSTADDLSKYAMMLLNEGKTRSGEVILKAETVRLMTSPGNTPDHQRRGLGWDVDTPFSSPKGKRFGEKSFGHTGFTGTSLWIDPETNSYVIVLTSRLHPDGKSSSPTRLRSEIATIVAKSFQTTSTESKRDNAARP